MSIITTLVGNLTNKPEVSFSPSGKAYARFTIAVNFPVRDKNTGQYSNGPAHFMRCVAFGHDAEGLAYFEGGMRVIAQGDLQSNEWTDKDNVLHKDLEMVVREIGASSRFQIVTAQRAPRNGGTGAGNQQHQAPQQQQGGWDTPQQQQQQGGFGAPQDSFADEQPF